MAKYVLKIKGKSYGVKRWFTRSVTIQLGVMKYNNVSINLKEFEAVTDDDYKRGKYDYYFELREKSALIDKPKIYQCRAEDEASFKEWINRIENICGRMDSYYLECIYPPCYKYVQCKRLNICFIQITEC